MIRKSLPQALQAFRLDWPMDSSASLGNVSQTEGDSHRPKSKPPAVTIAESDEKIGRAALLACRPVCHDAFPLPILPEDMYLRAPRVHTPPLSICICSPTSKCH